MKCNIQDEAKKKNDIRHFVAYLGMFLVKLDDFVQINNKISHQAVYQVYLTMYLIHKPAHTMNHI